jgi:hypothetical protein
MIYCFAFLAWPISLRENLLNKMLLEFRFLGLHINRYLSDRHRYRRRSTSFTLKHTRRALSLGELPFLLATLYIVSIQDLQLTLIGSSNGTYRVETSQIITANYCVGQNLGTLIANAKPPVPREPA